MAIVMTKDGHVRPLRPSDLKEVAERDERIRQLERLAATLAAQVDRMRAVVEAAIDTSEHGCGVCEARLDREVATYTEAMAQLAKEGR
jgi:hypothetical protein